MKSLHEFPVSIPVGKKREKIQIVVGKLPAVKMDAARHYYSQQYNQLISDGFLTQAMMAKKLGDIGGIQSKKDGEEMEGLVASWLEAQRVFSVFAAIENPDEEQKKRIEQAEKDIAEFQMQITTYKQYVDAQFASSADAHAEERTMRWLLIHSLHYKEKIGDKEEIWPIFDGANFAEKLNQFYQIGDGEFDAVKTEIFNAAKDEATQALYLFWQGLATEENMGTKIKEIFKNAKT